MKTILTALNARYSHSSLALLYLKTSNPGFDIDIMEFSINDSIFSVYSGLLAKKADFYCFSCYIWNIENILKIAGMLKTALPLCKIVFGGPECSYNADALLKQYDFIDHILTGEGEYSLGRFLSESSPDKIISGKEYDVGQASLPYNDEILKALEGKIIYFETSRGCPYKCSYCLSAAQTSVRYFPMDYVKAGFDLFFKNNVPLVKLVDRTFNADNKRAVEIIEYIKANSKNTKVHFEIEPHIVSEELIKSLSTAPKDMFQLEIGIQTTNSKTLETINRRCDAEKIRTNINRLKKAGNMHIHLDLIAGLPYETYESFRESLNYVCSLRPDVIQLGFLKVLHGAPVENQRGIRHCSFPPYEVIETDWMAAGQLCRLKEIENAVERFYNSGAFNKTINAVIDGDPFAAFEKLAEALKGCEKNVSRLKLYTILYEQYGEKVMQPVVYDFLINNREYRLPDFAIRQHIPDFKNTCRSLLKDDAFLAKYSIEPDFKKIRFEPVLGKVLMTDYTKREIYDIKEYFV